MQKLPSTLKTDPKYPLGLVLSGGGARGAFQVGVWEELYHHPRGLQGLPDVISGTSAGALNGALIAVGLSPKEILQFWLDLAHDPPVVGNDSFFRSLLQTIQSILLREPMRSRERRKRELRTWLSLFRKHAWYRGSGILSMLTEFLLTARFDNISEVLEGITTSYVFDTEPVKDRLRALFGGNKLPHTDVKLAINTVDFHTGKVVRIVNAAPQKRSPASSLHYHHVSEITVDMLLASASIPLLFKPITVGAMTLWDGGVLVNTPLAPAVSLGAERIIPVLVTLRSYEDHSLGQNLPSFGGAVERLANTFLENAYNVDRKLLLDRNELAQQGNYKVVELFRAIRPLSSDEFGAGSYLYFEPDAIYSMYEAGKRAAQQWLQHGPEIDHRELDG